MTEYVVGVLQAALCVLVTCGLTNSAAAATRPSLTVMPHQVRTRAAGGGLVPAWDTSWWVTIQAQRAQAPLTRLEYTARFTDSTDRRALSGGWDLSAGDAEALSGRLLVTCAARPDYDRHVRVQLRVRDALGATSEWVVADFPVRDEPSAPAAAVVAAPQPGRDDTYEKLGTVEAEATDDMTIGETRAQLQREARAQGGDTTLGLRLVHSADDRLTFAADVIRYNAATPAPTAGPIAAPSNRVIGEIVFPEARY